jgi:hypothetical protein
MRLAPLARRLGSAALVLTIGVGVSACSSDDSSAGSASSATDESGDDMTGSSEEPAAEEADAPAALSAEDFYPEVMAAMREVETFSFTSVSDSAGQARFGDDGVELKASGEGAQSMEMILLDKAMYMKSAELGTGDKWLKIDLSDPDSLFGMIGKATDPEVMFQALEAPKKLELVGTEDVDGVATNHYRITLDPTQYIEAMDFPAAMADMLPKELVTEMWVDADNLPRRFSQTMEIAAMGGGKPTTSSTEGTYSDFGADVEIEAPPSSEVTEQPGM